MFVFVFNNFEPKLDTYIYYPIPIDLAQVFISARVFKGFMSLLTENRLLYLFCLLGF